jgi:hypothetical protein
MPFPTSRAESLRGKSETLLLRLTWQLRENLPVGTHRRRGKTVPILP